MMGVLHPETLTVRVATPGPPDEDGVVTETFTERPWGPCNVQKNTSTENRDVGEVVTTRLWASGPLAEWITEDDRIIRDGREYRVDGEPGHFKGGALDHSEIYLIAWKGQ